MAGFGSQPYGSTPYGLGTPAAAPAQGGTLLRDEHTGVSHGSRRIDPRTRDYVLDDNGRILGMSDVQQLVQLAVATTRGTAAMTTLGQQLLSIDRITPNFTRRVTTLLARAVQHLVDAGLIQVTQTIVEVVRPGVARVRLRWRDLTTFSDEETVIQ